MILEYWRPKDMDEALGLLARQQPKTIPLGGGTTLSHGLKEAVAIVDLQDLPLKQISRQGNYLRIGAAVTLQVLLESPETGDALSDVLRREVTLNLRNMATIAGTLVTATGKSALATALLALDARLVFATDDKEITIGDWLPQRWTVHSSGLITEVVLPLQPVLRHEIVARSPADQPVVCVAVGMWPSGRTRVALGGFGPAPVLAMDGPEKEGAEAAVESAYSHPDDAYASGEYRSQVAQTLVARLLASGGIA